MMIRLDRAAPLGLLALLLSTAPVLSAEFAVAPVSMPEMKAVFGVVESRTVVPARARIGGTVRAVDVSEGDAVTEGQTIGLVVDDKLALQRDAAAASVKQAEASLGKATADLDRIRQLVAKGVSSQSQLDQMQAAYDVAVNQRAAAAAAEAVVEQQSREGEILAPMAGRVLTVPVTPGSVVMPGDVIARVASGRYYLRLSLPERHAATIREGDSVAIARRGSDGGAAPALSGRIAKVYPEITDGRVVADVDVAGVGDYFVGERTLVTIPVGTRAVLAVPEAAIATRNGVDTVRLADGSDVAVVPGAHFATDGAARVEILTGLKPGDRVIIPDETK